MKLLLATSFVVFVILRNDICINVEAFHPCSSTYRLTKLTTVNQRTSTKLHNSPLPKGISPFEKSASKNLDTQAEIRSLAKSAVDAAIQQKQKESLPSLFEIEFPPLLGGSSTKSQFDDFDNIQELNSNRDWTIQFATFYSSSQYDNGRTWLIFPDLKECELARTEWAGKRYDYATYTTLKACVEFLLDRNGDTGNNSSYKAPWGAALAEGFNKIVGSSSDDTANADGGLLGDVSSLDPLNQYYSPPILNFVIQPGNGGPVEDWINCETIYTELQRDNQQDSILIVVNGALDKVRDGYYPAVFFPKLAQTVDRFYKRFDSVFYLKPIVDKGLYGWLYRVYPEPWQVILQIVKKKKSGDGIYVEDKVVYTSNERPSYSLAVTKMVEGAAMAS